MTNPSAKPPVVLCHAACSGGSMIYRLLVSTFGFYGSAEIGHGRRTAFRFSPVDPEAQMFSLGHLTHEEFGDILTARLMNTNQLAADQGKRLLIREHTHNYFFNPDGPEVVPEGPSWVVDQFEKQSISVPLIVTMRDPVDSWLGFRQNFNHLEPRSFDTYCQRYNQFFDRVDQWVDQGKLIHVFKYEDCVVDPEATMRNLAGFLDLEYAGLDLSAAFKTASTGNSGRQGASLALRKRRPFTMRLVRESKDSSEYARLCSRLGYESLESSLTSSGRISATVNSMLDPIRKCGQIAEAPGKWIYKLIKSGRGVQ